MLSHTGDCQTLEDVKESSIWKYRGKGELGVVHWNTSENICREGFLPHLTAFSQGCLDKGDKDTLFLIC